MFTTGVERCSKDGAPIEERADDPLLGQVLAGRYRLSERLGAGGMGVVYRCAHEAMGKTFAVKVLYGELAGDARMVERFQREAQALSRLSHRHILAIVDFGASERGLLYLVTELIEGRLLYEEGPVLATAQAVHVVRQIARALLHAHKHGIIHRDLKPENIMIVAEEDDPHVVKLLDFGIAHVGQTRAKAEEDRTQLTALGTIMGTPEYMSPEQARGQEVDARADLYSLGVIFYELLAGRLPFEGQSPVEIVTMHLTQPPPPLSRPGLPPGLAAIVMKLLAKQREDRYADAEQLLAAFDTAWKRRTPLPVAPPPAEDADAAAPPAARPSTMITLEPAADQPAVAPGVAPPTGGAGPPPGGPAGAALPTSSAGPPPGVPAAVRGEWEQGAIIQERWEVFGAAPGSSGAVALVHDRLWDGLAMAVKTLRVRSEAPAEAQRQSFLRRTQEWRDLGEHPHLVPGYYTLELGGALRFFVHHVPARPLSAWLRQLGEKGPTSAPSAPTPAPVSRAVDLAIQLASALEVLHARNVVHGALRPTSCLVADDDTLRLGPSLSWAGGSRFPPGMAWYQAPEGGGKPPADVYAAGTILYELFAGVRPFAVDGDARRRFGGNLPPALEPLLAATAADVEGVLARVHAEVAPPPPSAGGVAVPPPLEALVLRCLDKNAAARPTAAELGAALVAAAQEASHPYERDVVPPAPTVAGACGRAAALFAMGEPDAARQLLDDCLGRGAGDQDALPAWLNRRVLAVDLGDTEAAAEWGPLAAHAKGQELDRLVVLTRARLAQTVLCAEAPVRTVAIAPAGQLVAVGSDKADEVGQLWATANGTLQRVLQWTRDRTLSVAFSPDGTLVVTGSDYGPVRLWDVASGTMTKTLQGHWGRVTQVAFSPDGKQLLTGGRDGAARLWSVSSGELVHVFEGLHAGAITVIFAPDGRHLFTAGQDGTIRLWTTGGQPLTVYRSHSDRVNALAVSPDGKMLVSGGQDGTARIFQRAGSMAGTLKGHQGAVLAVAFAASGGHIVTGSADGTARIWELATAQPVRTLQGHVGPVNAVAVSRDGLLCVTGGEDGTARLWGLFGPRRPNPAWPLLPRPPRTAPKRTAQSQPDALLDRFQKAHDVTAYPPLTAAQRTRAPHERDFDMALGIERTGAGIGCRTALRDAWSVRVQRSGARVARVAFGPDGRYLVVAGREAQLRELKTGRLVRSFAHDDLLLSAAVSTDGRLALTSTADGGLRLWELGSGKLYRTLPVPEQATALALSPDSRFALTGHRDHMARLWETGSGKLLRTFVGHTRQVKAVAFDPSGQLLVTGSEDRTALVWETASGELVRGLSGHAGTVGAVAITRGGRYVLTGSADGTARWWETGNGQAVHLLAHKEEVLAVAVAPDERLLVTASGARLSLWNGATGALQRQLGAGPPLTSLALSADGALVLSGADNGSAELWLLDSDWAFLETVLPEAEGALAATPSALWPLATADRNLLDAWLDLWRDVLRCTQRQDVSATAVEQLGRLRQRLLEVLVPHAQGAGHAQRLPELLRHPVYRTHLVDPALAELLRPAAAPLARDDQDAPAPPRRLSGAPLPAVRARRPVSAPALPGPARPWRHLSLSMLGLAPGVALLFAGPVGLAVGGVAILGGLWQGWAFLRERRRP